MATGRRTKELQKPQPKPLSEIADDLQKHRRDLDLNVKRYTNNLLYRIRALIDHLKRIDNNLTGDHNYLHNSLGEVQSAGPEIDRLCAQLAAARDELGRFDFLHKNLQDLQVLQPSRETEGT